MENYAGSSSRRRPHQAHEPGFDPNGWLTLGIGTQERQAARQTHPCLYCPRTFLSSEALGIHQYWHWRERERRQYAAIFPPTHAPIMPMFGPTVRVQPPLGLYLGQGLSAGAWGMNPMPPNGYPGILERRLGLRGDEDEDLLRRMDIAESEDGDGDVTEMTVTEDEDDVTEMKNMDKGHESGDGYESEDGAKESSKELDLTLRL